MKIAFYFAKAGTFEDKLIALVTRGAFSHVEVVFDESLRSLVPAGLIDAHDKGGSLCFSSSPRAPRSGCGFANIDLSDGKWLVVDLPACNDIAAVHGAALDCGRKYDWPAIGKFILPFIPDDRSKRICSEECIYILQAAGLLKDVKDAVRISPNALFQLVRGLH